MSLLSTSQKADLVKAYQIHGQDVGSPEVQVAFLTTRINNLAGHFAHNKKDNHSRRGLLTMVNKRRSLLKYLKSKSVERYQSLISRLELRDVVK